MNKYFAYISQVLAGCSATGAVFADGEVTSLRIILASVAALASIAALLVTLKTSRDQEALERKLHLLVETEKLPYTLETDVNDLVSKVASQSGFESMSVERLNDFNFYRFTRGTEAAALCLRHEDLRRLWMEPPKLSERLIRDWLESGPAPTDLQEIARLVVFAGVAAATVDENTDLIDPMRITSASKPDGTMAYTFEFPSSGRRAYEMSMNVNDWDRTTFGIGRTLADLYDRVRREVGANSANSTAFSNPEQLN